MKFIQKVALFLTLSSITVSNASAIELDEETRTVTLDASGNKTTT